MSSLFSGISRLFSYPSLRALDPDSEQFLNEHKKILDDKPSIRHVFQSIYERVRWADEAHFSTTGNRIEIGAGSSFLKQLYPDVTKTDIKSGAGVEQVVDATRTPFTDQSVRAYYCINCFHHFPDVRAFFKEVIRTVKPGGGVVIVDPHHGPIATLIYKVLFRSEDFDKSQLDWRYTQPVGSMKGANQALAYVVLNRDREIFLREFPELELVHQEVLPSAMRYLFSGGLNFKQVLPGFMFPVLMCLEWLFKPLSHFWGLHHLYVLRKK